MVKSCSAKGCCYEQYKGDGVKMHKFPTDAELRKKWVAAIGRENFVPSKAAVICSQHFESSCYESVTFSNNLKLKKGAIPTIFYNSKSIRPVVISDLGVNNLNIVDSNAQCLKTSDSDHEGTEEQQFMPLVPDGQEETEFSDNESNINQLLDMKKEMEITESFVFEVIDDNHLEKKIPGGTKRKYFIGEFAYEDLEDEMHRQHYWSITQQLYAQQKKKIKYFSTKVHSLKRQVMLLKKELLTLKQKNKTASQERSKKCVYTLDRSETLNGHS